MNADRKVLVYLSFGTCAFILSKGLLDMFLLPDPPPYGGNAVARLIEGISFLSVAITLVSYSREAFFVVRRNWILTSVVILALASCLWAEKPAFVFQRSVAFLGTTLLGIAFATRLSLQEQLRLMSWMFRIGAILSLSCALFLPSYGISTTADSFGNWQGIYGYKNMLGSMMAMSILVEWHRPLDSRYSRIFKFLAIVVSAVLLFYSDSITPLIALVSSLLFIEIYKFTKLKLRIPLYAIVLAMLLICVSGMTVLVADSGKITSILGRESNLTGRTEIWSLVLSLISQRPVWGFGYSGVWYGASSEASVVDQAVGEPIMYSHNGYLETLLTLGAVGLLLVLAFLVVGLKRAYYCFERGRSSDSLWPLAFLSFFLLYNMGEATLVRQDLQWALCVAVIASADIALVAPETEQEENRMFYVPINEPA